MEEDIAHDPPPSLLQRLMHVIERVWRPAGRGLPVATALRGGAPPPRQPRPQLAPAPRLRKLGRRRILAQLGHGSLGTIWKAYDLDENAAVAIKVLHPHLAEHPEIRGRFFRSARLMADLAHPGVARVREPECRGHGFFYYVMDLYEHGTLHDAVLRKRLLRSQFEPLVLGVARALAVAHERGMVHREVKPTHILFSSADAPCLIDFDLASAELAPDGLAHGPGQAAHVAPEVAPHVTPEVAPELWQGAQQADARADVYGLGMTMAFMLHGAPLPHGIAGKPERFVRALPCEPPLRRVLERAVAWDPERRFAHAGAFCSALEETMGRFRSATMIKLVAPGAAPHLRGIPSLLRQLRAIEGQPWLHSPVLARFDMDPDAAAEHARARRQDMRAWKRMERIDQRDRVALRRLEYLVREWAFGGVYPLVHALPAADLGHPVIIGRGRGCDVTIRHEDMGKRHAAVVFDPDAGGYRITAEDARHGTRIDGELLAPGTSAVLRSGNVVALGGAVFVFFEPRLLRRLARAL